MVRVPLKQQKPNMFVCGNMGKFKEIFSAVNFPIKPKYLGFEKLLKFHRHQEMMI
jgi:hypothetical protein